MPIAQAANCVTISHVFNVKRTTIVVLRNTVTLSVIPESVHTETCLVQSATSILVKIFFHLLTFSGTCECYSDASCNNPNKPHCNSDTFECVECTGDLQCSSSPKGEKKLRMKISQFPGPYCYNNTCVGCAANWQCRNKTSCNSYCYGNQCVYGNLSCAFECNPNNGTCVCMNDTQCLNSNR
jgi:hypothetical protein